MNKTIYNYLILFVLLILFQVLVFNNLVLFNVAVCYAFIYIVVCLPMSLSQNWVYTIAFVTGLIIDIFSDTPGLNALSSVLLAAVRRPVLYLYVSKDDKTKSLSPSIRSMGWSAFSKYLLTLTVLFCLAVYVLDFFNLADIKEILVMAGASTLFTFPVLTGIDCLFESSHAKRL